MQVKLVSMTQPLIEDVPTMTPEQLIVYVARASNPSNQKNMGTSEKLLRWMVGEKHWSPFELVEFTVEIKTSRAISAQILRHRSFSFQEFSQRYATVTEFEPVELRKNGAKNRQSSLEVFEPEIDGRTGTELISEHIANSEALYHKLLQANVAKECARMILPLTTQTTVYMKGSVRSWIHYLHLRTEQSTQLEHRLVAEGVLDIFKQHFPITANAMQL